MGFINFCGVESHKKGFCSLQQTKTPSEKSSSTIKSGYGRGKTEVVQGMRWNTENTSHLWDYFLQVVLC